MTLLQHKTNFLLYELGLLTVNAALATRDEQSPFYAEEIRPHQRQPFKAALRGELQLIEAAYSHGRVEDARHCDYIESLAERVSQAHSAYLHGGRFRIGVAQKLVNLHLKYLWVAGFIEEPPHCPIDGIIRDLAGLNYNWKTSDSRADYESAVAALSQHANPLSLSVWELQQFRRRGQIDV